MRKPARKAGKAAQRLPHPNYYTKRQMGIIMTDLEGKNPRKVNAMVYVMTGTHLTLRMPMRSYYNVLAEGYERFGFNPYQLELALNEAKEAHEDELS